MDGTAARRQAQNRAPSSLLRFAALGSRVRSGVVGFTRRPLAPDSPAPPHEAGSPFFLPPFVPCAAASQIAGRRHGHPAGCLRQAMSLERVCGIDPAAMDRFTLYWKLLLAVALARSSPLQMKSRFGRAAIRAFGIERTAAHHCLGRDKTLARGWSSPRRSKWRDSEIPAGSSPPR